jgi:predicted permease
MRAVPDTAYRLRSAGAFGWLLAIVIAAILAMSCVNVANLLLADADRRRKDLAIRLALGAGRSRIVGQLLAESLLLAAAGGAAGLGIASLLVRFLPRWQASMDGFAPTFVVDSRVAVFSLVLVLLTSVLFGLFPALRASRPDLVPELKAAIAARSSGGGTRIRGALIVGQLAATLVLLAATGLMLRSLDNLVRADLGFPRKDLLTVWVHTGTREEAKVQLLLEQWVDRVRALPGVRAASMARRIPICPGVGGTWTEIHLPSSPLPVERRTLSLSYNAVGLGFFRTLGIPLLEGRDFSRLDDAAGSRVAIVNETMARRFWPQGALGQPLRIGGGTGPAATVVGVARDTRVDRVDEPRAPYFYVPRTQDFRPFMTLVVEAEGDPLSLVRPIRAELATLDPELPSGRVITLRQALRLQSGDRTSVSVLLSVLGVVALTLAIVGLYGIIAYVANQRTRELGIRLALGAPAWRVGWLVLRQAVVLVGLGLGFGVLAAAATTRLLGHLLYGVRPMDPGALVAGAALLATVSIAGCLVPARRAARLQPAAILNEP